MGLIEHGVNIFSIDSTKKVPYRLLCFLVTDILPPPDYRSWLQTMYVLFYFGLNGAK